MSSQSDGKMRGALTEEVRLTKKLVRGTWALAAISGLGLIISVVYFEKQLDQSRQAVKLEWRPYLLLEQREGQIGMNFRAGESFDSDNIPLLFDSVSTNDLGYVAVKSVQIAMMRNVRFINKGNTPLRIAASVSSTLTENEWKNKYHKSADELVHAIRTWEDFLINDVDYVLTAGESRETGTTRGRGRRMPRSEFDTCRLVKHELLVYYFTYAEYLDIFDNRYNVLLVEGVKVPLIEKNGFMNWSDPTGTNMEKYRWDIDPEHNRY
jgi:hypothetical protein